MLLVLATALLLAPAPAQAQTIRESGRVAELPWSGYWWPTYTGHTNLFDPGRPLEKYDRYIEATTGTRGGSQEWERRNRSTNNPAASWWGHCHAWAAASIWLPEPPAGVTRNGISFTQDDLEGLITALYYQPVVRWINGRRAYSQNDPRYSAAAYEDMFPAWLDYVTRLYIGYYRYPVIFDIDRGPEVWNFPAYAYERTLVQNANGTQSVTLRIRFASATLNTRGTRFFERTYTYTLRPGTLGQYTGASRTNHPDFSWIPGGRRQSPSVNPHIDPDVVNEIIGGGYRV